MSTSNNSSAVQVLTVLDAYAESHDAADTAFQTCLWNLTKARRSKLSSRSSGILPVSSDAALAVSDLRQEQHLDATSRIKVSVDNDDKSNNKEETSLPQFSLINPKEEKEADDNNREKKELLETPSLLSEENVTETTGLRQRKKGGGGKSNTNTTPSKTEAESWSKVDENQDPDDATAAATNNIDYQNDLLYLLGGILPPRELRVAQEHAKAALQGYIEAANFAVIALQQDKKLAPSTKE